MGIGKKIFFTLLIAFISIQFFRPARNLSSEVLPTDITNIAAAVPLDVVAVLKKACYDCHSNNTRYPWYMNVQPAAWFLADHISSGKAKLNFSGFGAYPDEKQAKKLSEISKEVRDGGMPLSSYTLIHKDARLTDAEKTLIADWADSLAAGKK